MAGPLAHVRVLDLSRIMAGPWAGQMLADLGADVIKVERPEIGDDTRRWGPPFLKDKDGKETSDAGYFLAVNRGKRSIALNIADPKDQALVRSIAKRSDVVLENFKVGTLKKYGLDYDSLHAENDRLIYCSITGFGQTGPRARQSAYDFMIQAMGGLMSVTGLPDEVPGGGPQKVGVPITDIMTGMYGAIAILAALANRAETGRGEHIDIGMLDVQASFLANQAMNYLISGHPPKRTGNAHPNIQPQDVFACRDGHIVLVVGNDEQFSKFCVVVGRPEWIEDERFSRNTDRVNNIAILNPLIANILKQRDLADWLSALDEAGVACGPINTVPMVFEDPQIKHREILLQLKHVAGTQVPLVANPIKFKNAPIEYNRAPPVLNQDGNDIRREFIKTETA